MSWTQSLLSRDSNDQVLFPILFPVVTRLLSVPVLVPSGSSGGQLDAEAFQLKLLMESLLRRNWPNLANLTEQRTFHRVQHSQDLCHPGQCL